jgi:hypothetical protein
MDFMDSLYLKGTSKGEYKLIYYGYSYIMVTGSDLAVK